MYKILNKIHSSADVHSLTTEELELLCVELRKAIMENVSKTGGHLASNLGAVELTAAIHRVYDTSCDRLVFDVGHQCYAHKMISGRLEKFDTLRKMNGISGFPRPWESSDDACVSGHASTSISNALGMARARTILGEDYDVVAVIGDGALTGGLAYVGLNDCGDSGEPIVIVLNDNEMSIDRNVGGMARLLARLRVKSSYIAFKKIYRRIVARCGPLYRLLHHIKEWVKDIFLPDNMFENMGFYYLGPIDGHDMKTLVRTLRYARELRVPTIVHVLTVKGKGYEHAESAPEKYHGVGSFDPGSGIEGHEKTCFSSVFGSALSEMAEKDEKVVGITAAMVSGTGMDRFAERFPKRFFDVGIAEGHAVSLAAGMAKQGLKPVFAVYSTFLQRSYDMLIHDVGLDGLHVVLGVDRSGLVGADGETHQGVFDLSYLSMIPNLAIAAPKDTEELRALLDFSATYQHPLAIRYPRAGKVLFEGDFLPIKVGKWEYLHKAKDDKLTIIAVGERCLILAMKILQDIQKIGLDFNVVNARFVKPLDVELLNGLLGKHIITIEDNVLLGGFGSSVCTEMAKKEKQTKIKSFAYKDAFIPQGGITELQNEYGVGCEEIEDYVKRVLI